MSILSIFKIEKEEVSLLVDIGNGNIQAALVSFSKGRLPRFLHIVKLPFIVAQELDLKRLTNNLSTLLDSVLTTLIKQGFDSGHWKNKNKKLSRVLVTYSSPWFVFKAKQVHISKARPFYVTGSLLDSISQKEEGLFKSELLKNFELNSSNSFDVIEKSIVNVKINGYLLHDSIGQKTKTLDVFMCMSAISRNIKEKVESLILQKTGISKEQIFMHTFPLVSFSTVRDTFLTDLDFILADITSEITDITFIKDGSIVGTTSFPLGRNLILRQISKAFHTTTEIAESTIHMYQSKKINPSLTSDVEKVFADIEKEWAVYFENMLLELSPNMILPKKVYVTANNDTASVFIDFLKSSPDDSASVFKKTMTVIHVNLDSLKPFYESVSSVQVDEFIVMLAIFYNKMFQSQ